MKRRVKSITELRKEAKTPNKTAKAFMDLARAEDKLVRAFNKWSKARAKVRRLDKKFEKELLEGLPGEMDVRKMPIKPRHNPRFPIHGRD